MCLNLYVQWDVGKAGKVEMKTYMKEHHQYTNTQIHSILLCPVRNTLLSVPRGKQACMGAFMLSLSDHSQQMRGTSILNTLNN